MKNILLVLFCCMSLSGSGFGAVLTVTADVNDARIRTGTAPNASGTNCRIGTEAAEQVTCFVMPFLLPALPPGESVTDAVLQLFSEANTNPNGQARLDVLGVRTATNSTVLSSDLSSGSLIVDGAYILDSSLPINQMLSFTSTAMTVWFSDIYASGSVVGKYVFLAVSPDVTNSATYRYVTVSTANNATNAQWPKLTLCTGGSTVTQEVETTSISQFGITWVCQGTVQTGQYANGDYWVVGPVNIISIANSLRTVAINVGTNRVDGAMINPSGGAYHGYDSRLPDYNASLNKALPGGNPVSAANPLALPVNSSLISSVSWTVNEPGCPDVDGATHQPRPITRSMAILTCVSNAPPEGTFRPAYCGSDKSSRFNKSQLDYSKLANLNPVSNTPALINVETNFAGPWVDHVTTWSGSSLHPYIHMPDYGRDLSIMIGQAALMLQLDFSKLPGSPNKEKLLVRFTQLGIDLAGIADTGGNWGSNGGIFQGRKFPILFASVVLNDSHMKSVGSWSTDFQEDLDTFYVAQTNVIITHSVNWSPDIRDIATNNILPYTDTNIGLPEWGIRHTSNPYADNLHWAAHYRDINIQSYPGWVLAAHIMGQRAAWNHEPLFDYIDRSTSLVDPYNSVALVGEYKNATYVYGTQFVKAMWQTYRTNYPPQWVPDNPADVYGQGVRVSPNKGFLFSITIAPSS